MVKRQRWLNERGEIDFDYAPYLIQITCDSGHDVRPLRGFESVIFKAEDDGHTPMSWRMLDAEEVWMLHAGKDNPLNTPLKGGKRRHQVVAGRYKFHCDVCKDPPREVRAEKLHPIFDKLARGGAPSITLKRLAVILERPARD